MRHNITIFGTLDDTDVLADIADFLYDPDDPPLARAKQIVQRVLEREGKLSIARFSRAGGAFDDLKDALKRGNLSWMERIANKDKEEYTEMLTYAPGFGEERTIAMASGEPTIELSYLLAAEEKGPEAVMKTIADFKLHSFYGNDPKKLTFADDLLTRFEAECRDDGPTPKNG